ncbi:MAG: ImmA/IrrE family metallo-endopeptidase [Oceanipulchritudo sp.]
MKHPPPRIAREREEMICSLADSLGEDFFSSAGTDLKSLLTDRGINLHFDSFKESFDGLIDACGDSYHIYCNTRTGNTPGSTRARFTIAHELGHYFIDEHRHAIRAGAFPSMGEMAPKDLIVEREADLFASRLLLPNSFYLNSLKKAAVGLKGIVSLANQFDVSIKCSALRYLNEDHSSCALSFWSWERNLIWKWYSTSMWNAGIRKIKAEPIRGGATDKCLRMGPENPGSMEDSAATIGYLFHVGDGVHHAELVSEEAMSLGEFGVLSLIHVKAGKLKPMAEVLEKRYCR